MIIERLSIPSAELDEYFRPFYILHPIFASFMIIAFNDLFTFPVSSPSGTPLGILPMWVFPFTLVISIIMFFTTTNSKPPIYNPFFVLLGLVMSIIWISSAADELVACLGVLGQLLGVPKAILGLTVLAWGNSIGDFVSDVLVARRGYPALATSAVYSSPITHLLLGLGLSFIIKTQQIPGHTIYLNADDLSNTLYFNFLFLIIGLLFTLVTIPLAGFMFSRFVGVVLLLLYLASMIVVVLDLTHVILDKIQLWEF